MIVAEIFNRGTRYGVLKQKHGEYSYTAYVIGVNGQQETIAPTPLTKKLGDRLCTLEQALAAVTAHIKATEEACSMVEGFFARIPGAA